MMRAVAEVAPPNSLILVMDPSNAVIPTGMNGRLVAATPSCIAVGTLSEHDGTTRITMTDEKSEHDGCELAYDGVLETPSRRLAVCSVLCDPILQVPVSPEKVRVQVWTNDSTEPSEIQVLVSDAGEIR